MNALGSYTDPFVLVLSTLFTGVLIFSIFKIRWNKQKKEEALARKFPYKEQDYENLLKKRVKKSYTQLEILLMVSLSVSGISIINYFKINPKGIQFIPGLDYFTSMCILLFFARLIKKVCEKID